MSCANDIMQILHYVSSMDISLFRDLERLSQTGNFSQAAARGNLSQPAFSRRIKALENWVGVILVDRSRQPVSLTDAGKQILEAGLQALSRIEQERSQILEAQAMPDKYVVSFAAQHSIGWRFYPSWLQTLENAYGPVLSRLRADDLPNCMRDLERGDVDFVIAFELPKAQMRKSFDWIVIGHDELIAVSKPMETGAPLFDLEKPGAKIPFLRFGDAAPISAMLEPTLAKHDLSPKLQTIYENSMAGALRMRARAGDGVAWLPKSLVAADLEMGALVRTGSHNWKVALEIRLMRNGLRTNRITRAIWTFLEQHDGTLFVPNHIA